MTPVTRFRIVPIPAALAVTARRTVGDAESDQLLVVADGKPHQCRLCLRLSAANERVILMSYTPFATRQPYAETGPVFVHERECRPYDAIDRYPPEFPRNSVVLRAYDTADRIVDAEAVGERKVEDVIAGMFVDPTTVYLHARNLGYGCFMFRIDRA